jgi:hypothetical protein
LNRGKIPENNYLDPIDSYESKSDTQLGFNALPGMLGANKLIRNLSIFEDKKGRDRLDAVFGRQSLFLIHIHLPHHDLTRVILRNLLKQGGNHPTGSAPLGPEIHQYRYA